MLIVVGSRNQHDFPNMFASIDCMHWEWRDCPTAWNTPFAKRLYRALNIILELVASYDVWIWYAFPEMPRSINDTSVLDHSLVFNDLYQDRATKCKYFASGHGYKSYTIYPMILSEMDEICENYLPWQGPKANLFINA